MLSSIIAKELNSEIISADSRQIYKLLNIGTAKPPVELLQEIKHHFIDELLPDEEFNVSNFENKAASIIDELHQQEKIPVITGGSGLYIKALIDGIIDTVDIDKKIRDKLFNDRIEKGNQFLYNELEKVDPISAASMLPQNWKRVIRALEVYLQTGVKLSQLFETQKKNNQYKFFQFGLRWNREVLYSNIEKRVDGMIAAGLVDEVKSIIKQGYSKTLNSLNTVGYKEIIDYLESNISLEKAVELIKRNTRRYAKRQMTWFRKDERIVWIDVNDVSELLPLADTIIKNVIKESQGKKSILYKRI